MIMQHEHQYINDHTLILILYINNVYIIALRFYRITESAESNYIK